MSEYKGESLSEEEYKKKINTATGLPFGEASEIAADKAAQEMSTLNVQVPGTPKPEDTRTTGQKFSDWAHTPGGTATLGLGALGLATVGGIGLKNRRDRIAAQNAQQTTEFPELSAFDEHIQNTKAQAEQLKVESLAQKNAHDAEKHQAWRANEARKEEERLQKLQGKASNLTSSAEQDIQFLKADEKNKLANNVAEASKQMPVANAAPSPNANPMPVAPRQGPYGNVTMNQQPGIPNATGNPLQSAGITPLNAPTAGGQAITPPITTATPADTPPPNTPPTDTVGASEERRPSYSAKRNKRAGEEIGQGGWHWYQGQMGSEAQTNWEKTYGKTNQSYETVKQDIASGKLAGPTVVEGRGGSFPREATVPHYIKGNASVKGMASLGTLAAALGLAGSEKGQEAMGKAAKAIKDIGFSPDILTNKAEEMGRLGTGYVTAGNPSYRRELEQKLKSTTDPEFRRLLEQELTKISPSSNSPYRSVPPPR
jgi:flagellar biosynthesis GTPase FlhF